MGRNSCRHRVTEAWICRFFLLSVFFCRALCSRISEKLSSDLGTAEGADGAHRAMAHNRRELRLAATGKDRETYIKNFETAVTKMRKRSAGKGGSSLSDPSLDPYANPYAILNPYADASLDPLGYGDVEDGSSMGPTPVHLQDFCPAEWMPLVADDGMQVGKGAFGVVYVANVSCQQDKIAKMAFKVQIDDSESETWEEDQAEWIAEGKLGMNLSHPYVIKVFDTSTLHSGMGVIAMEAANGGDLKSYFGGDEYATVSRAEVAEFTLQILWGLKYMHDNSFVHADFKPEQVMLQCDSQSSCEVRIADLGLAVEATSERPFEGLRGSPFYVAPEIPALGLVYPASDMWAVGVSLHMLLNHGDNPTTAEDVEDRLERLSTAYHKTIQTNNHSSVYSEAVQQQGTVCNQLLDGLLKYNPLNRISATSAIGLAKKWAEAEGVDQSKIEAIMRKGQMADLREIQGATKPFCWQKCKDIQCGDKHCKMVSDEAQCMI